MRATRFLLCGLALTACGSDVTAPSSAPELAAGGIPPHVASASGAGHFTNPLNGVFVRDNFTARSDQFGVTGEYQRIAGAAIIHGTITCLTVVGNEAWIGGTIDRAAFTPVGIGSDFVFRVIDNGEGGVTKDVFGRVGFNLPAGSAVAFCGSGVDPVPLPLNERDGNVQVRG
ncbi:MAG TPA: hypothetical protein VEB59_16110 [Gemmatimonadales bacterium]|nr:hypothetical protein [Gemmatimonadales bacterium]